MCDDPQLHPPPKLLNADEYMPVFESIIPGFLNSFPISSLGFHRKINKKKIDKALNKLRRSVQSSRPYILGLVAMTGNSENERYSYAYALFEGLIFNNLKQCGIRIKSSEDALEYLLKRQEKMAKPNKSHSKLEGYMEAHNALVSFARNLLNNPLNYRAYTNLQDEWFRTGNMDSYFSFTQQFPHLINQCKQDKPFRFTNKTALQLTHEYSRCATFFEERIRLLIALAKLKNGEVTSWEKASRLPLAGCLKLAMLDNDLKLIASNINVVVRNVVAHKTPIFDLSQKKCTFRIDKDIVAWSFEEFFNHTRKLTITNMVLMKFEVIFLWVYNQNLATLLWKRFNS
jgi:hypothetical protein